MRLRRRQFLQLVASATALPAISRFAWAQTYPTRPVRLLVGYAAGGGNDIVARLIGQWLADRLGQNFVIENRPGAGTNIATEEAVHALPDGYTLLLVGPPNAINATLYKKLNFNFIRDIAAVGGITRVPQLIALHPSVPVRTVPELIAYTKAKPGKLDMASAGIGSGSHLAGELFEMMAGVKMMHVPYRGAAPALVDLLAGRVQIMFPTMAAAKNYVTAGKLRALAITAMSRWEALPDLPTVNEFVPGFEASAWYGIGAPSNTPSDIVEKLNNGINAGLADPKLKARFAALGGMVIGGTPGDLSRLIADETAKWGKVIRAANIRRV
jgi:tripartite-type tricarboxylate transporter receptor subunit TctC